MKDFIVSTMPIKPQFSTSIGMSIAPMLVDFISKKIDAKNALAINLLHSYEKKDSCSMQYILDLNQMGLDFDRVFLDQAYINDLYQNVVSLIDRGFITKRKDTIFRCECGRVDIAKKGLRMHENGDLYYWKNNRLYCRTCQKECKEYQDFQLYLYLDPSINDSICITPNFLQSEISHFHKTMPGTYILVSKNRKTECSIDFEHHSYFIDHDLLWMNFIQCFQESHEILIASNHQLYEMYLLNYINKMAFLKDLNFVATPYLKKSNFDLEKTFSKYDDAYYKKLCLLYSMKWRNKDCHYDESIFKGVAKLGAKKRKILYDMISERHFDEILSMEYYLNTLFLKEINMQRNMEAIRKRVLNEK